MERGRDHGETERQGGSEGREGEREKEGGGGGGKREKIAVTACKKQLQQ